MKHLTLLVIILFTTFSLFAQNDKIFGSSKNDNLITGQSNIQEPDNQVIEVSFNPGNIFGSSSGNVFSLINGTIKYRHFKSSTKATRYGVKLLFLNDIDVIQQADSDLDLLELKSYTTVYGISFMPGGETYFNVSDKISPYVGWQFLLGYQATFYTEEFHSGNDIETETVKNSSSYAAEGFWNAGVGVFSSVDYYFVKHFYVGVELGIGADYMKKTKKQV